MASVDCLHVVKGRNCKNKALYGGFCKRHQVVQPASFANEVPPIPEKKEDVHEPVVVSNQFLFSKEQPLFPCRREYVSPSNEMYDIISKRVRESYPKACLLFVEKVVNPKLDECFEKTKQMICQKSGKCVVRNMFHGTKETIIDTITSMGFDPSKNKVSAYGKGTYFAKNAKYSVDYTDQSPDEISYMFLADVLVGKVTPGSPNQVIKQGSIYDNFSNSDQSIIVTPYTYGAYPRYVIAFHKNAK
jgi:hypothetical protein